MIKKTIEYYNFEDQKETSEHYFHMSKIELSEFLLSFPNGLENHIKDIFKKKDTLGILEFIKTLVKKSYGVKSQNGNGFIKNPTIVEEFIYTPAYDSLVIELMSDVDKLTAFMNGIVPKDIAMEYENNPKIRARAEKIANELVNDMGE